MNMCSMWAKSFAFGLVLVVGATASAASGTFSIDGNAEVVSGGKKNQKVVLLTSDVTQTAVDQFGVIEYTPRSKGKNVLELDELRKLSATYQIIAGGHGGGSPRFQIAVDTDGDGDSNGNVWAYLGDPPNFTSGTTGLISTGNLLDYDDVRFDASQLEGGDQTMTYEEVIDLFGEAEVLSVDFAVDAGWFFPMSGVQSVVVTQLQVNSDKLNVKKLDD
jgi:hypothetical protein